LGELKQDGGGQVFFMAVGLFLPHAPGSKHRKLEKINGEWFWEENLIIEEELIK